MVPRGASSTIIASSKVLACAYTIVSPSNFPLQLEKLDMPAAGCCVTTRNPPPFEVARHSAKIKQMEIRPQLIVYANELGTY